MTDQQPDLFAPPTTSTPPRPAQDGPAPEPMRAPFPYAGSKRRIAERVWSALGDVRLYAEPFCGSAAVLLARPHAARDEIINDADSMVANFWRAVRNAPEEVARHTDWPVIETGMHARHRWLIGRRESLTAKLEADLDFFDARIAGWWCWGACMWIGGLWCSKPYRRGISSSLSGVLTLSPQEARDALDGLAERLRSVRVATGDWERIVTPAMLSGATTDGSCGVFLDPPYDDGDAGYSVDASPSASVRAWCEKNGSDRRLRIVLAGYDGEHNSLEAHGWTAVAWKATGGYANRRNGNTNKTRERLWLSPHCLRGDGPLFGSGMESSR